mgnify:CR=1 FL=1
MPLSAHEFERRLIFYASPTLTKLKVACIYNLNDLDDLEECIQYYNELLNKKDIYNYISNYDIVGIDEFCFLKETNNFISLIKNFNNIDFYIASLDMDYKRNYWESVTNLIEEDLIDIHIKVFGKCDCGRKGIYSKRIAKDIDRIVIGDDIYKCVCRYCYAGEDEVKLNL